MAVLDADQRDILRFGLGFDACDVGIVLNVTADYPGVGDINTIEQLAHLKSVVAETVLPSGYAVLNADDPLVVAMAARVKSKVAYFTLNPNNQLVRNHIRQGGLAAVLEDSNISVWQDRQIHTVEQVAKVPLTMGGQAPLMIANALAASLAAFAQGVTLEQIKAGLNTFKLL